MKVREWGSGSDNCGTRRGAFFVSAIATAFFVAAMAAVSFAQGLPKIAVYVAGDDVDNRNKALGRLMLNALAQSGRYRAVEQPGAFYSAAAEAGGEDVDFERIMDTGKRYGAAFVCVAEVAGAGPGSKVSAVIVDAKTQKITATGEIESSLETFGELSEAAQRIVAAMLGMAAPAPKAATAPPPAAAPPPIPVTAAGQLPTPEPAAAPVAETSTMSTETMSTETSTERATGTVAPTQPNSLAESKPSAAPIVETSTRESEPSAASVAETSTRESEPSPPIAETSTRESEPAASIAESKPSAASPPTPPAASAADTGKPNIAVYVTGEAPEEEKRALGTRILASLVNSGRYRGIERSSVFLAEIDREMVRQRSGAIDDDQISELGKQFGVRYICITDLTPAYDAFQVSARIVNVETAEVLHIGEAFCPQKTALYITWVSENVVRKMFGQKLLPEPNDPSRVRISAGAGAFIPVGFGGGVAWGNNEAVAMPYLGAGAYMFVDVTYVEAFLGYSSGGGKWQSVNAPAESLPGMWRSYLHLGVYAKYPFGAGTTRISPVIGAGYDFSLSGKLQFPDGEHYVFNGNDGRHGPNAMSALWAQFGGGLDVEMGKSLYLRGEFLYGLRTASGYESAEASASSGNSWAMPGHGFTIKVGIGAKLAELRF